MSAGFAVTEHAIDDQRHVLAVHGEIDVITAPVLKEALTKSIEAGRIRIVVDLTHTTYLDSAALGVLIGALRRLRPHLGTLVLVNVDETITTTFEVTALDQILTIVRTREAAIDALAPADVS